MLSRTKCPFLRNNFRYQKKIAPAPEMTKKKPQKKQGGAGGGGGDYWLELSGNQTHARLFGDHDNSIGVEQLLARFFLHQQEQEQEQDQEQDQDQEQEHSTTDYDGDDEEEEEEEEEEAAAAAEEEEDDLRRLTSFLYHDRSFLTPWSRVCDDTSSSEGQFMLFGSDSFFSSQVVRV